MTDLGPKRSIILPEHSVLASTAEHRLVAHQAGPATKEAEAGSWLAAAAWWQEFPLWKQSSASEIETRLIITRE